MPLIKMGAVYVAGPLFAEHERNFLEHMVEVLASRCSLDPEEDFFLPHRDAGDVGINVSRGDAFDQDIEAIDSAQAVVALLDGVDVDSGTALELGYAYAKGIPVFGILTDRRSRGSKGQISINNMIWGVCNGGTRICKTLDELADMVSKVI